MGHTTPGLALRVYAQAMRLEDGERERLRAVVDGVELADIGRRAADEAQRSVGQEEARRGESRSVSGGTGHGRGWFRTTDLSRVKRALSH